jgi:hypothetical protein
VFGAAQADEGNHAYATLRDAPPGRLLDLPVFLPDVHLNSTYLYYDMQARRERPTGYSTTAPAEADRTARRLRPLACGRQPTTSIMRLGIRYVAVHEAFYRAFAPRCLRPAIEGLRARGFRQLAVDGDVTMFFRRS